MSRCAPLAGRRGYAATPHTRWVRWSTSRTCFSSYATRHGVIGAVIAMISALFILMLIIVVSAAAGT